jgi:hypothetical protein
VFAKSENVHAEAVAGQFLAPAITAEPDDLPQDLQPALAPQ